MSDTLNAAQLARIQNTHRGFLYQHLYAVSCLLMAPQSGVTLVRVERDEDLELENSAGWLYAQIKLRTALLAPSDLDGVLARFSEIRTAHANGSRAGSPRFAIVSNAELGPTLAAASWPEDVFIVTPASPESSLLPLGLAAPLSTVDSQLVHAADLAERYRSSALRPMSLVAKLVGLVSAAAANIGPDKQFETADLDRFCELVAAQLRPLPVVREYVLQVSEPTIPEESTPLVVAGHAGDGKSAWAAHVASTAAETAVYLPLALGDQVAPRAVDAAIATLAAQGSVRAHELVQPRRAGLDALAFLDQEISSRAIQLLVVVDDCHNVSGSMLAQAIRAAPHIRWIVLGRPSESLSEAGALLGVKLASFGGWSDDVIAGLLSNAKCSTDPEDVAALRRITGGAPLFVLHAIRSIEASDRDTGGYARALQDGTTPDRPAQEVLLEQVVRDLDSETGRVCSVLACAEIRLRVDEWAEVAASALATSKAATMRALRRAVDFKLASVTESDLLTLHDAFRPLLADRFVSPTEKLRLYEHLAEYLRSHLWAAPERTAERILAFVRILALLGRVSELADVANAIAEWFRETGIAAQVRALLESTVSVGTLSPIDRFWALDTLCFFDIEEDDVESATARLRAMRELATGLDEDDVKSAVLHKSSLVALGRGELVTVREIAGKAQPGSALSRILRYQLALGERHAGNIQRAVQLLLEVAQEYLEDFGLTPKTVLGKNPEELFAMMKRESDPGNLRRLADCYDVIARLGRDQRADRSVTSMATIWAMKFYSMASAPRSALRTGQDFVDVMIRVWGDARAARQFMEQSLLPSAAQAGLPAMTIAIRAQYAVVCAHYGDYDLAEHEMSQLSAYVPGLSATARDEIENQRALIAQLRQHGVPTIPSAAEEAATERRIAAMRRQLQNPKPQSRIGPNERCSCGSGKKYKKCCGGRLTQ